MKRIGILTYHFSDNYGAVFQAYALIKYLTKNGYNVEIIDYEPDYVDNGAQLYLPSNKENIKKNLIYFYQKGINFLDKYTGKYRSLKFQKFRDDFFNIKKNSHFKNINDIESDNNNYDLIIVGSDQIWNPGVRNVPDPVYYTNFNHHSDRTISYAASFGTATPKFNDLNEVRECMLALDAIGVREKSGIGIVDNISGVKAIHVPDPTFLIRDYKELITEKNENDYIFSYVLRSGGTINKVIDDVSIHLGCSIIKPKNYQRPWLNDKNSYDLGPKEWISSLVNSKFVISNSFHGVALSINLNKPFAVVLLPGTKAALNERVLSLLSSVGLDDRVINTGNINDIVKIVERPIDWLSVNKKLSLFVEQGSDYLDENLK